MNNSNSSNNTNNNNNNNNINNNPSISSIPPIGGLPLSSNKSNTTNNLNNTQSNNTPNPTPSSSISNPPRVNTIITNNPNNNSSSGNTPPNSNNMNNNTAHNNINKSSNPSVTVPPPPPPPPPPPASSSSSSSSVPIQSSSLVSSSSSSSSVVGNAGPVSGPGGPVSRSDPMPKVQDALGYLERVKTRFHTAPQVYNQFLDIMKDFKSQTIDTEGVIRRVKALFKGHRSLILGFNQFLPPGYKIDIDKEYPYNNQQSGTTSATNTTNTNTSNNNNEQPNPNNTVMATEQHQQVRTAQIAPPTGTDQRNNQSNPSNINTTNNNNTNTGSNTVTTPNSANRLKPTIEFNHAVQYVAKIKHRFREAPEIYSEFLDILHDYQAKRTIDEVYTRVSKLFQNQPDLLDEFKYFLPDSAREHPANKSNSNIQNTNISHKISSSQSQSNQQQGGNQRARPKPGKKPSNSNNSTNNNNNNNNQSEGKASQSFPSGQTKSNNRNESNINKDKRDNKGKDHKQQRPKTQQPGSVDQRNAPVPYGSKAPFETGTRKRYIVYPPNCERELSVLEKLRDAMAGKGLWPQFIRALNLFSCDIITRPELIRMTEDICLTLNRGRELLELFKQAIGYDEWEEKQLLLLTQTNYYAFVSSVDFSSCPIVTPSYRELPAAIQAPHSSGRTAICDEVLNDRCVSTATGSEDYSFKSSRKNVYEENLFKVEDERFELDMLIENNAAAIRVLEPIAEQAAVMSPEQAIRLKLGENIDTLHLRAITRVYGDNAYEIIELLQKAPAATTKLVLARLRQKDLEWRQVRADMKNTWRKTTEANYIRSLDHRSFYFKQEDKKRRSPKALMNELREVHQQVFGPKLGEDADEWGFTSIGSAVGEESIMLRQIRQGHAPQPIYTYCMSFKYQDNSIHQQLYEIITLSAKLTSNDKDVVSIQAFFTGFVHQFFEFQLNEKSKQEQIELAKALEEKRNKQNELEKNNIANNLTAMAANDNINNNNNNNNNMMSITNINNMNDANNGVEEMKTIEEDDDEDEDIKDMEDDNTNINNMNTNTINPSTTTTSSSVSVSVSAASRGKRRGGFGSNTTNNAANNSNSNNTTNTNISTSSNNNSSNIRGKRRGGVTGGNAAKRRRGGGLSSNITENEEEDDDELLEPEVEIDRAKQQPNNNNNNNNNSSNSINSTSNITNSRMGFDRKEDEEDGEDTLMGGQNNENLNYNSINTSKRDASNSGGIGSISGRVPSIFEIGQRISSAESIGLSNNNNNNNKSNITGPSVKPLRVQMETWGIEEKLHPVRRHTRPSRLFFGSNAYYVFFRLHQFLYERLYTARQLAHKTRKTSSSNNRKQKLPVTPEEREQRFSILLEGLLSGKLEQSKFEDECRNLLGASSYVLFTIDKLIQQLVKQTLALLNSDTSLQLLCLYQYELVRQKSSGPINLERSAQLCRMYHSNCQSILSEDNCTQIEFFQDTKELGIGLIEALSQPESQPKSEEWSKYLDQHINTNNNYINYNPQSINNLSKINKPQSLLSNQPSTVPFLTRNIRSFSSVFNRKSENNTVFNNISPNNVSSALSSDLDLLHFRVSKYIETRYELEAKIDLRTCKVYYVEDTSDFMYRTYRKKPVNLNNNNNNNMITNGNYGNIKRTTKIEEIESHKYSSKIETIISKPIRNNSKLQEFQQRKNNGINKRVLQLSEWANNQFHILFPNHEKEMADKMAAQAQQEAEEDARALTGIKQDSDDENIKQQQDIQVEDNTNINNDNNISNINESNMEDTEMLEDEESEPSVSDGENNITNNNNTNTNNNNPSNNSTGNNPNESELDAPNSPSIQPNTNESIEDNE